MRTARKARRERLLKVHRRALLSSMGSEFNGGFFYGIFLLGRIMAIFG